MASTFENSHIRRILALLDVKRIRARKFRVAFDAVNGAGGRIGLALLKKLSCTVHAMGTEMNGAFPHTPEPTPKNLESFSDFARTKKIDIGFALDPDADRLVLMNSKGEVLLEEYAVAIAAWHVLNHREKGPVVVNQSTSRMSEDIAKTAGCAAYRSRVGEVSVVDEMIKRKAVIGGEGNGGVIDPRLHYGRDGIHGMALMLNAMAVSGKSIEEIVALIPRYHISKDKMPLAGIPFAKAKKALIGAYPDAERIATDGIRFAWSDRWLHVRSSNTEPIIRLFAETPSRKESDALVAEAKKIVAEIR